MAGKGYHYVKEKGSKPLFTKKDIRNIIIALAAVIVIVAAFFCYIKLSDDTLTLKNGSVSGVEDNWIIANSGTGNGDNYYKYCEYDFEGYDGEVVPGKLSFDENGTCVELFPSDGRYANGYVYATAKDAETVVRNVVGQIGGILAEGTVYPYEEFEGGYIFYYTAREDRVTDEESEATTPVYIQVFTAYIPAAHDGTVIVRVTYEFESPECYVDAETGYSEVSAILSGITIEK